jgi:peptidoglycan/LPS O-acetylase OafA/YrhL
MGASRIPTLDGWRGVAILTVVVCHFAVIVGGSAWWIGFGHGVRIFFVLSGFLITSRLLAEERTHLGHFYLRRFFRLMPTAWSYLLLLVVMSLILAQPFGQPLAGCLFFFRNYQPEDHRFMAALTGHFWSLSIEEQFYLAWPVTLLLLGRRRGLWAVTTGFLADAAFIAMKGRAYDHGLLGQRTEVNVHFLLAGCILALLFEYAAVRRFFAEHARLLLAIAIPGMIAHFFIPFPAPSPTESVFIAIALGASSSLPSMAFSRFLDWKPMATLGAMSYSMYVWQAPLVFLGPLGWKSIPVRAVLILLVSAASCYGLEKPCIEFGRRLGRKSAAPLAAPLAVRADS